METPELIDAILGDIGRALRQIDPAQVDDICSAIQSADRIFIAGKGRSGLQMKAFAMRLMHLGLSVHVVDDVTTPAIDDGDLLLIGSASGRTGSLLRYIDAARETGATLAAFTGSLKSPIAAAAASVMHIPATNFKAGSPIGLDSVLVMGSLFEHCLGLLCDLIVIRLKLTLGAEESAMNARHANLE